MEAPPKLFKKKHRERIFTHLYLNIYLKLIRGHMVAANHMDNNSTTIWESMHMTNIMPQAAVMNQQAYLRAEEVFECWRDIVNLKTIVGIVMGNNATTNYFVNSHGVETPDWYWRIIKKETDVDRDGDTIIAWLFVIFN
jgi:endonuclease G